MSRSRNTEKESVQAVRGLPRNASGEVQLPRVVDRKPRRGDIHPIPAPILHYLLGQIPPEYVYGLSQIELRPRLGTVGRPFGTYRWRERIIVLYSLPWLWKLDFRLSPQLVSSIEFFGGDVRTCMPEQGQEVEWQDWAMYGLWFYREVLAHELGHHFRRQYDKKNGPRGRAKDEELVAELHAQRLMVALTREFKSRRVAGG